MTTINTSNVSFTSSGNLRFSGLTSGIDSQAIIDALIAAKRTSINNIQDKITLQQTRKTDFETLRGLATTLTSSLDKMRGNLNSSATDVFRNKLAFNTTSAAVGAPVDHTPSAAGSLIGITASKNAQVANHQITINQLAQSHQIRSGSFNSLSDDMDTLGVTSGTMELNGVTITVNGTDTLADVRDRINNSEAGVSATIVSASSTSHYLVLTSEDSGSANEMAFTTDFTTSDSLGFTTGGDGTIANELREGLNANLDVNGITGIERESNVIDDIIEGVTLTLFAAEPDTVINTSIENDLAGIKSEIANFITAYNDMRAFVTDQRTEIDRDGDGTEEFGSLAFNSTLTNLVNRMGALVSGEVAGATANYKSLSQVGISIDEDYNLVMDDAAFDAKLLANPAAMRKLFSFDFSTSDSQVSLLGHTGNTNINSDGNGGVNPYYLNIAGVTADVVDGGNFGTSSGVGTASDGSLNINGKVITIADGENAAGLQLLYTGTGSASDVQISFTRGVADDLYFFLNDLTKTDGTLDSEMNSIDLQIADYEDEVSSKEEFLTLQRANLEARFIAMETALAQLNSIRETLTQFSDALQARANG